MEDPVPLARHEGTNSGMTVPVLSRVKRLNRREQKWSRHMQRVETGGGQRVVLRWLSLQQAHLLLLVVGLPEPLLSFCLSWFWLRFCHLSITFATKVF